MALSKTYRLIILIVAMAMAAGTGALGLSSQRAAVEVVAAAPAALQASGATLAMQPGSTTASVNSVFTIDLVISAGSQRVDGAAAHIDFNPAVLRVVDSAGNPATSLIAGPGASAGGLDTLAERVDNQLGRIDYAAARLDGESTGTFTLATIRFKAIAPGNGNLRFVFDGGANRKTDVTCSCEDVRPDFSVLQTTSTATVVVRDDGVATSTPGATSTTAPSSPMSTAVPASTGTAAPSPTAVPTQPRTATPTSVATGSPTSPPTPVPTSPTLATPTPTPVVAATIVGAPAPSPTIPPTALPTGPPPVGGPVTAPSLTPTRTPPAPGQPAGQSAPALPTPAAAQPLAGSREPPAQPAAAPAPRPDATGLAASPAGAAPGTTLRLPDGQAWAVFPPGAVERPIRASIKELPLPDRGAPPAPGATPAGAYTPPAGARVVGGRVYEMAAADAEGGAALARFSQPVVLAFRYEPAQLGDTPEASLTVHVWQNDRWTALPTRIDSASRTAIAETTQPGTFAILGESRGVAPGPAAARPPSVATSPSAPGAPQGAPVSQGAPTPAARPAGGQPAPPAPAAPTPGGPGQASRPLLQSPEVGILLAVAVLVGLYLGAWRRKHQAETRGRHQEDR